MERYEDLGTCCVNGRRFRRDGFPLMFSYISGVRLHLGKVENCINVSFCGVCVVLCAAFCIDLTG